MAAVDIGHESPRQENNPQDDTDEQPHEGARTKRTFLEKLACKRIRHRRRLPKRVGGRQQRFDDDHARQRLHAAPHDDRGGGHAQFGHPAGPTEYPEGAPVHHKPHEEGRRGGGGHQRLEVRRHGGRPFLLDNIHYVHDHRYGCGAVVGAAHNRPVGTPPTAEHCTIPLYNCSTYRYNNRYR